MNSIMVCRKEQYILPLRGNFLIFFGNSPNHSQGSTESSAEGSTGEESELLSVDSLKYSNTEETFSFVVVIYFWKNIEPIAYLFKRNKSTSLYQKRYKLQKNKWTDFLRETIWKNTKSRCS